MPAHDGAALAQLSTVKTHVIVSHVTEPAVLMCAVLFLVRRQRNVANLDTEFPGLSMHASTPHCTAKSMLVSGHVKLWT